MANDRIFLHCRACNSLGPLLAKYWVGETRMFERADAAPLNDWLSHHLLLCRPASTSGCGLTLDGALWIGLTDEAGAAKADRGETSDA